MSPRMSLCRPLRVLVFHKLPGVRCKAGPSGLPTQQLDNSLSHELGDLFGDSTRYMVFDELLRPPATGRYDGDAASHGLQGGNAESLLMGGDDEQIESVQMGRGARRCLSYL